LTIGIQGAYPFVALSLQSILEWLTYSHIYGLHKTNAPKSDQATKTPPGYPLVFPPNKAPNKCQSIEAYFLHPTMLKAGSTATLERHLGESPQTPLSRSDLGAGLG
jgi:hypothetical protein